MKGKSIKIKKEQRTFFFFFFCLSLFETIEIFGGFTKMENFYRQKIGKKCLLRHCWGHGKHAESWSSVSHGTWPLLAGGNLWLPAPQPTNDDNFYFSHLKFSSKRDVPTFTCIFYTLNWLTLTLRCILYNFTSRLFLIFFPGAKISMWHCRWGFCENT